MAKAAAADEPCFDGSPVGAEVCPAEPPASTQHSTHSTPQQQQQPRQRRKSKASHLASDPVSRLLALLPWKLKRRHKQQLAVAAELLIGVTMSGLMAWGVVLVLQRVMQVGTDCTLRCVHLCRLQLLSAWQAFQRPWLCWCGGQEGGGCQAVLPPQQPDGWVILH